MLHCCHGWRLDGSVINLPKEGKVMKLLISVVTCATARPCQSSLQWGPTCLPTGSRWSWSLHCQWPAMCNVKVSAWKAGRTTIYLPCPMTPQYVI